MLKIEWSFENILEKVLQKLSNVPHESKIIA